MIVVDKDYIVEHFGTKGMHWGVRKERSSGGTPKKQKQPLTPEQKQRRIEIGLTVLAGGVFAASLIADHHASKQPAIKFRSLQGGQPQRSKGAERWLRQNKLFKETAASSVRTPPAAKRKVGQMSNETKKFLADMATKQNQLIREANGDLKAMDEKLQIPIHAREYLQEWVT